MFLLNSRFLLVTATCDPIKDHRHHLYQRYMAIVAEFPKQGYPITSFLSQEGAPVSVLSTIMKNPFKNHFHGLQDSVRHPIRDAIHTFTQFSSL